ncbi:MAG: transketolase C-terminal domain-containing protein [Minwuia sp.]|nr:transketolase C-terminal domain-containing protein [Minwuia sp.]
MAEMTYAAAGAAALAEAMEADRTVWALGEDLGRGGVFGQYAGLEARFGAERIVSTPISEAAIMGVGVGAAMTGTRPVVEMRFADFALCATDELINQAAKARFMFGGQTRVPLTVRMPVGMWRSSAAQHSQSLEALYTHIPGLVVMMPATPADNHAMLKAAILSDDPVVYLEHKNLWPLSSEVPEGAASYRIGTAGVARQGSDLTIVTWSASLHDILVAAERAAQAGVADIEVLDLRTLWPWDKARVLQSVRRTGRLLIAHEAVVVGGFGAEVAATVAEELHSDLKAPVRRIGAPKLPIGYAPTLENEIKLGPDRLDAAITRMMS